MFRDNPNEMREASASICLVVPIMSGVNDTADIVDHYLRLAPSLQQQGWRVFVLLCALDSAIPQEPPVRQKFINLGVEVISLNAMEFPSPVLLTGPNQCLLLQASERVRHGLEVLQESHHFHLIEFPDRGGLGFRSIQAKQAGLGFRHVPLIVAVHGPSCWMRRQQHRWPIGPDDLTQDFAELYAFQHADQRVIVSPDKLTGMEGSPWDSPDAVLRPQGIASEGGLCSKSPSPPSTGESGTLFLPSPLYSGERGWGEGGALAACNPFHPRPLVTVGMAYFNHGAYLDSALASLAAQTYDRLEVIVIDDGSTDSQSQQVFRAAQAKYPQFQFLAQANSGIGATRNRALTLAAGDYFLPMDSDNIAAPDMVRCFVEALKDRPELCALTCYFLAFAEDDAIAAEDFLYAFRPTGGPYVLGAMKNVYGDGNALFRTSALRAVGGFGTDRDSSWEDWEVFVKLVNAGYRIDVVPEYLFYYRHHASGFSRRTDDFRNRQRVLRRFCEVEQLNPHDRSILWSTLMGFEKRLEFLENENRALHCRINSRRHRLADKLHFFVRQVRSLWSWL